MACFDTYFFLEVLKMAFAIVEGGNVSLQGKQPNFCKAEEDITGIRQSVSDARTDAIFGSIWGAVVASVDLNESIDASPLQRLRKIPLRIDDNVESVLFPRSMRDVYHQMYFSVLDNALVGITDRFEPDETAVHFRNIERFLIGKDIDSNYISQHYADDLDCTRLKLHRDIPEVRKLLGLALTSPVSSCTAERSFSGLRRLKTYLRSSMSQERLNAVALMNVHKDIMQKLSIGDLLDKFIGRSSVRKKIFWLTRS